MTRVARTVFRGHITVVGGVTRRHRSCLSCVSVSTSATKGIETTEKIRCFGSVHSVCSVVSVKLMHDPSELSYNQAQIKTVID